jgi:cytochrome c553
MRRSGRIQWRAVAAAAWAVVLASAVDCPTLQAADAAAGRQKTAMCQTCHGIDGVGKLPDVPHIAGENTEYLVSQLEAFRSGKRQHEQMSIIASGLSDEDVADLAAWYSSIQFTVTVPE